MSREYKYVQIVMSIDDLERLKEITGETTYKGAVEKAVEEFMKSRGDDSV